MIMPHTRPSITYIYCSETHRSVENTPKTRCRYPLYAKLTFLVSAIEFAHSERLAHGSQRSAPLLAAPSRMLFEIVGREGAYRRGGHPGAEPHIAPPLLQSHRNARRLPQYAGPLLVLLTVVRWRGRRLQSAAASAIIVRRGPLLLVALYCFFEQIDA